MLQYTTGDIIKRAQELADLQNSDFISWSENMHLLDESYKKLYQECINANDKYYLTSCTPSDLFVVDRKEKEVRYELPEDFYQLHSIIINRTATPLMKKALTESSSSQRYDIINNCIVIYGGAESMDLTVNYYPVPKTLTLKAPEVEIEQGTLPEGDIVDVNGTKYLIYYFDNANFKHIFYVYDITTGHQKKYVINYDGSEGDDDLRCAYLGKTCFAVNFWSRSRFIYLSGLEIPLNGKIAKKDGYIYIITPDEDSEGRNVIISKETPSLTDGVLIKHQNGNLSQLDGRDENLTFDNDYNIYGELYSRGGLVKWDNQGKIDTTWKKCIPAYLNYVNNSLYYSANKQLFRDDEVIYDIGDFADVIGVNKIDYNTGYGISVTSYDDENIHIKSCFNDTVLDFPNNFYFNFLAYQLAIAYKAKQGADYTALNQLATEEAAQFFNSLSRDTAENCRIQNVYGGLY